jgi:hypothetical protein
MKAKGECEVIYTVSRSESAGPQAAKSDNQYESNIVLQVGFYFKNTAKPPGKCGRWPAEHINNIWSVTFSKSLFEYRTTLSSDKYKGLNTLHNPSTKNTYIDPDQVDV